MAELFEGRYANCEQVTLVCDDLNTHTCSAFYEVFEPAKARAFVKRTNECSAPKHDSWLNIAENELSAITRQCVGGRRIGTIEVLASEIAAWSSDVHAKQRSGDINAGDRQQTNVRSRHQVTGQFSIRGSYSPLKMLIQLLQVDPDGMPTDHLVPLTQECCTICPDDPLRKAQNSLHETGPTKPASAFTAEAGWRRSPRDTHPTTSLPTYG